jgi:hypothetical protein
MKCVVLFVFEFWRAAVFASFLVFVFEICFCFDAFEQICSTQEQKTNFVKFKVDIEIKTNKRKQIKQIEKRTLH